MKEVAERETNNGDLPEVAQRRRMERSSCDTRLRGIRWILLIELWGNGLAWLATPPSPEGNGGHRVACHP